MDPIDQLFADFAARAAQYPEWQDFAAQLSGLRDEIWNTRGQSDKAVVADTLRTLMGAAAADPYVKHLEQAIDALDRTP